MSTTTQSATAGRHRAALCVYAVCMARLNVYVPDELATAARDAGLNVSALTQEAISAALNRSMTDQWLAVLPEPSAPVSHERGMNALEQARAELGV